MKQLKELNNIRKIHFVGIGGAGMSPLAKIVCELGYEVTGSDRENSGVIENLCSLGAKVSLGGQKGENVRGADAIVVSSAIPFDNPEVLAAKEEARTLVFGANAEAEKSLAEGSIKSMTITSEAQAYKYDVSNVAIADAFRFKQQ